MDLSDAVDDLADAFASTKIHTQLHNSVVLIHEPHMQAHAPKKNETGVHELPQRIIAIENVLRGSPYARGTERNFPPSEPRHRASSPPRTADNKKKKTKAELEADAAAARERESEYCSDLDKLWADEGLVLGGGYLEWEPVQNVECVEGSLWSLCRVAKAHPASYEDLLRVHPASHLQAFARQCMKAAAGGVHVNGDLYYGRGTLKAARLAAGGAIEAVKALFVTPPSPSPSDNKSTPLTPRTGPAARAVDSRGQPVAASFAIIRPPGHHCCTDTPAGFCFLSNVAIAAAYARSVLGLERVAIVDTDYHPGDGSQQVFYSDPSVLTISTHVACRLTEPYGSGGGIPPPARPDPSALAFVQAHMPQHPVCIWPYRRDKGMEYNGSGRGEGMNINIPWPCEYVSDEDYEEAMTTIVVPALQAFRPQLILWASGFDAAKGDSLAGTLLSTDAYWCIGRHLASAVPDCPVAAVLEGGYDPLRISLAAENLVRALLGADRPSERRANNLGDMHQALPAAKVSSSPGRRGDDISNFSKTLAPVEPSAGTPLSFLPAARQPAHVPPLYAHAPEVWAFRNRTAHSLGEQQHGPWPDWSLVADKLQALANEKHENLVYLPDVLSVAAGSNGTSSLRTPLGRPWRPSSPYLGRPEAIMEATRRRLNRLPAWAALSSPVFRTGEGADMDEAVQHDARILSEQLHLAHSLGSAGMKRTLLPGESEEDTAWAPTPDRPLLKKGEPPAAPLVMSEVAARPTRAAAAKAVAAPEAQGQGDVVGEAAQPQAKAGGKGGGKRASLGGKSTLSAATAPASGGAAAGRVASAVPPAIAEDASPVTAPKPKAETKSTTDKKRGKGMASAAASGSAPQAQADSAGATGPATLASPSAVRNLFHDAASIDSMSTMREALSTVLAEVAGLRTEVKDLRAEVARLQQHDR